MRYFKRINDQTSQLITSSSQIFVYVQFSSIIEKIKTAVMQMGEIYDPSHRYRRGERISQNGIKTSYRAFDQQEGAEVIWNEINYQGTSDSIFQQLCQEVESLIKVKSSNVISLLSAWINKATNIFYFVTELFTTQTIRSYTNTVVREPHMSVISNWVYQILQGLSALHHLTPPYICRDLRCDNIYIDPSENLVKIGIPDFELILHEITPSLAAPEVQKGHLDPKSDVWSLGLCVVEIATQVIPYSEFKTPNEKRNAVVDKIMPQAISQVPDPTVADFVATCLQPVNLRPSVLQLMEHSLIIDFITPQDNLNEKRKSEPNLTEPNLTEPNLTEFPEFLELIERQNKEKKELEDSQKAARHNLRMKIRERTKKRSFRELLSNLN